MVRHATNTAVFVLLERAGEIFMLRRANTGYKDGWWTLPSGHVEQGQTVRQAATTEVREEAAVEVMEADLEFVHVHYVFDVYTNFYFRTSSWTGEPSLGEPHLCSEVRWFTRNELPGATLFHVQEMLSAVAQGEYFSDTPNDPSE